jgi:putative transcriptional regulator
MSVKLVNKTSIYYISDAMRNRLRVIRAERDWSQADLAARLSVSRQTVNAIETGRSDPSLPLAFRIAKLLGALIEEIFVPEGEPLPQSFGM